MNEEGEAKIYKVIRKVGEVEGGKGRPEEEEKEEGEAEEGREEL